MRRLLLATLPYRATALTAVPRGVDPAELVAGATVPARGGSISESAGLAHDAGNLLGALGLYCELLGAPGVLRPEHRHYAAELGLISARSAALIGRLLSSPIAVIHADGPADNQELQTLLVARNEVSVGTTEAGELSHAVTLRNLAPVLERIAAGSARVMVSVPVTLPAVELAAEALERITVNLVRNAAQAIHQQQLPVGRGEIRVTLGVVAGRLQLTVEDNGPGMSPRMAAAFLQPAGVVAAMRRGLGHRIVHELVASSGGQLSIRARPGLGTVFCLKWPLAEGQVFPAVTEIASDEPSRNAQDRSGSEQLTVHPSILVNHLSPIGATAEKGSGQC